MFRNIRENRSSILIAVISNSVILMIFGVFLLGAVNLGKLFMNIRENIRIIGYLNADSDPLIIETSQGIIASLPGVYNVKYISKNDALSDFTMKFGDTKLLEGYEENPLPASFEIFIETEHQSLEELDKLAKELNTIGIFSELQYGKKWLERFNILLLYFNIFIIILFLIVSFSTMVIISSITKLTLLIRNEEIAIMKSIGATNNIVRMPFIMEGALLGVLGGTISLLLLRGLFHFINIYLLNGVMGKSIKLVFVPSNHIWIIISLSLIAGIASTLIPLNTLLKDD